MAMTVGQAVLDAHPREGSVPALLGQSLRLLEFRNRAAGVARGMRLAAAGGLLAGLVVLIPGSPAYLPNILNRPGQYDGHSNRYWARALESPDAETRRRAAFSLWATGTEAGEAVPALASVLLQDPNPDVRREVALALIKMAPASRGAVPALAGALGDEEPAVRMNAVIALFRLGAESRPAV